MSCSVVHDASDARGNRVATIRTPCVLDGLIKILFHMLATSDGIGDAMIQQVLSKVLARALLTTVGLLVLLRIAEQDAKPRNVRVVGHAISLIAICKRKVN